MTAFFARGFKAMRSLDSKNSIDGIETDLGAVENSVSLGAGTGTFQTARSATGTVIVGAVEIGASIVSALPSAASGKEDFDPDRRAEDRLPAPEDGFEISDFSDELFFPSKGFSSFELNGLSASSDASFFASIWSAVESFFNGS